MSCSRRQFLTGLAALTAGAAVPGHAARLLAPPGRLYPPVDLSYFDAPLSRGAFHMRIGYAAITWEPNNRQAIDDISSLGYQGIQLRAALMQQMPDPHAVRDLLARHRLAMAAFSSNGDCPLDAAGQPEALATHIRNAKYLQAAGGRNMQVLAAFGKGPYSAADYKKQGQFLNEVGKRVADYGVLIGFHNHMGTAGQTPEQVAAILEATDPRYVKLALDTAHYQEGGGDPVEAVRKYHDRLLYLHLKDLAPAATKSGYQFVELGQGKVNFPAFFAVLRAVNFRGWGIIELDDERIGVTRTPKQSAEMSKQYLESQGVWA